jgi:hypothetical protein
MLDNLRIMVLDYVRHGVYNEEIEEMWYAVIPYELQNFYESNLRSLKHGNLYEEGERFGPLCNDVTDHGYHNKWREVKSSTVDYASLKLNSPYKQLVMDYLDCTSGYVNRANVLKQGLAAINYSDPALDKTIAEVVRCDKTGGNTLHTLLDKKKPTVEGPGTALRALERDLLSGQNSKGRLDKLGSDKLLQFLLFLYLESEGLPIYNPPMAFISSKDQSLSQIIENLPESFGSDLVLKSTQDAEGKGNFFFTRGATGNRTQYHDANMAFSRRTWWILQSCVSSSQLGTYFNHYSKKNNVLRAILFYNRLNKKAYATNVFKVQLPSDVYDSHDSKKELTYFESYSDSAKANRNIHLDQHKKHLFDTLCGIIGRTDNLCIAEDATIGQVLIDWASLNPVVESHVMQNQLESWRSLLCTIRALF